MIDFNNAESIDRAAKEFVSSHDLLKVDFSGYRKCHIGDDNDIAKHPGMKELIDKDKYGEYLGSFYNQLKREKSLDNVNYCEYICEFKMSSREQKNIYKWVGQEE